MITDEERQRVAACGEFCHVTIAERLQLIDNSGLDPAHDVSLVIRGPKREQAVYLCPAAGIENAKDFIGARASDQPKLYVYRIAADILSQKDCGPDIGYLVNIVGENDWTVEVSLRRGTIACYETIPRAALVGPQEVENPRYTPASKPTPE